MSVNMVRVNSSKPDPVWHIPVDQGVFEDCDHVCQIKTVCGCDVVFLCREDMTNDWVRDSRDVTIAETCQLCLKRHITKPRS